jgi:peptidoglycan/xylan/chitin deacetylase (PgdA/CDA1 family)
MIIDDQLLKVCAWRGGKDWVYSITFDEALTELHQHAVPILEQYSVPGHLEVVVGQMGQVRRLMQSSYNGMNHMGPGELQEMLARGWGVGNHSWSHTYINLANVDRELGESKRVLEEAIGEPVTVYCSPGGNFNMVEEVLAKCWEYGYIGAMALYEALNRPDDEDLLWLNRTFLHDNGPDTFDCEFDPYRKIQHAKRDQGWIIDYCHCPLEEPVHPRKDCSAAQLRERIETVIATGGDSVWLAKVEDAMDYRYVRRHLRIERVAEGRYRLLAPNLPPPVRTRLITLELPAAVIGVELDGMELTVYERGSRRLVDVDVEREPLLSLFGVENR